MYECQECGAGTPDSHRSNCRSSPEGEKRAREAQIRVVAEIKLREVNEALLSIDKTFEELGLNDRARAVREARWKLNDEAL